MTDFVIVGILIILIIIGIRSSVKHFKGEGGCCGGGGSSVKVKRKKLKQVVKQKTVVIEGMTCEHCKARVESRLNALDGISAKVNLKKKTAVVSMEKDVKVEVIKKAIENAGYEVIEIR
ncbi:MAG: heavy-metal-associated domain-containing protein [Lachnospiraceae bacterium]